MSTDENINDRDTVRDLIARLNIALGELDEKGFALSAARLSQAIETLREESKGLGPTLES